MIVITGGSGFIGSNLLKFLNENQNDEILIVLIKICFFITYKIIHHYIMVKLK